MAYKPVSQNVTDNKNAEIPSSDAVFDKIQAEISTLFPAQSGNAGKFLTTDGDETSWANVPASANLQLSNLVSPTDISVELLGIHNSVYPNNSNFVPSYGFKIKPEIGLGYYYDSDAPTNAELSLKYDRFFSLWSNNTRALQIYTDFSATFSPVSFWIGGGLCPILATQEGVGGVGQDWGGGPGWNVRKFRHGFFGTKLQVSDAAVIPTQVFNAGT